MGNLRGQGIYQPLNGAEEQTILQNGLCHKVCFFFFFFLTSYQSEKDGSELTPSCWKSLSFPCSRKADILKPKLGTFSPSQCCGWHKAGQFSLLHSLQSFIFSCPSCLEDDFLNPASHFFCWWALRSSSGAVFLSSFGVPRGQVQTWDICFWACLWAVLWGPLPGVLENSASLRVCKGSLQLLFLDITPGTWTKHQRKWSLFFGQLHG